MATNVVFRLKVSPTGKAAVRELHDGSQERIQVFPSESAANDWIFSRTVELVRSGVKPDSISVRSQ